MPLPLVLFTFEIEQLVRTVEEQRMCGIAGVLHSVQDPGVQKQEAMCTVARTGYLEEGSTIATLAQDRKTQKHRKKKLMRKQRLLSQNSYMDPVYGG